MSGYVWRGGATATAEPEPDPTPRHRTPARPKAPSRNRRIPGGTHEFTLRFRLTIPRGTVGTMEDLTAGLVRAFNGKAFRVWGQWLQIQLAEATLTKVPASRAKIPAAPPAPVPLEESPDESA